MNNQLHKSINAT